MFKGVWDSKEQFDTATKAIPNGDLNGKKVVVLASNTSALCLEIARSGAYVIACEPDPYKKFQSCSSRIA